MKAPVDRVMETYALMVKLTPDEEADARRKVTDFLENKSGDEQKLAVEALKHLLGRTTKRRRPQEIRTRSTSTSAMSGS
jgi:hypothetical protein